MLDWTDLQNQTAPGTGSFADADDINKIAHEVINNGTAIVTLNAQMAQKQDVLTFDSEPIHNSSNPVTSEGIYNFIVTRNYVPMSMYVADKANIYQQIGQKSDNITIVETINPTVTYDFGTRKNQELRALGGVTTSLTFSFAAIDDDYVSAMQLITGSVAPTVAYTNAETSSDVINWLGTDCTNVNGVSTFTPGINMIYDIIFYSNGQQIMGIVNGYQNATSNGGTT